MGQEGSRPTGLRWRSARHAARDPANTVWQRDFAVSQSKMGDLLVAQGDRPGGLAAYRAALAIGEALAARDPTNSQWLIDVAASCGKLGSLAFEHPFDMRRVYLTRGREILVRLKTEGRLLPHHDRISWFNEQIEQQIEEDGQVTAPLVNEPFK